MKPTLFFFFLKHKTILVSTESYCWWQYNVVEPEGDTKQNKKIMIFWFKQQPIYYVTKSRAIKIGCTRRTMDSWRSVSAEEKKAITDKKGSFTEPELKRRMASLIEAGKKILGARLQFISAMTH